MIPPSLQGVLLRWFAGLCFVALCVAGIWTHGYRTASKSTQAKQERDQAKSAAIARATEDALHGVIWNVAFEAEESRIEREKQTDAVVAGLRAGTVVVRPRLQCPKLPGPSEAAGAGDGETGGGLLREDAEFLLHEASRADAIADQLRQCQTVVTAYYEATQP